MSVLHNLIASGKTKEALNILLTSSQGYDPDVYEEAILLSARFEKYLKDKRLGLIDSDLELRNIEYSILQLSGKVNIQANSKNIPSPKKYIKIIIAGIILAVAIAMLLYVFFYPQNNQRKEIEALNSQENITRIDSPVLHPTLTPDKNKNHRVKSIEKSNVRTEDSVVNNDIEKPGKIQAEHSPDKINSSINPIPQPIENTPEVVEYIKFKLIVNASISDYSIIIDGKPADFLDDSNPIIKTIRLKKSNQIHKIELRQGDKIFCEKNQLIAKDNQTITMPCTF